jgi:hypothetical protein
MRPPLVSIIALRKPPVSRVCNLQADEMNVVVHIQRIMYGLFWDSNQSRFKQDVLGLTPGPYES